jgi:hydroxymethylbilane synthase
MRDPAPAGAAITVGTRGSALARWQADWVVERLQQAWPGLTCRVHKVVTAGDRNLHQPLPEIGGKGLFTTELEHALRAGQIDVGVHSLKDLPIEAADGISIGAIPERADARDVLIAPGGQCLADLPAGARVGTSSLRRAAQLLLARPDLAILPLRGNVDTRIAKARRGDYDAIVLAAAGVERLGLQAAVTQVLPFEVMLPAPGQGALAIQCRAGDARVLDCLAALDLAPARAAVEAERAFLSALGGGCAAPVAAYAELEHGCLKMRGLVAAADGRGAVRVSGSGGDPASLGQRLAESALAEGAQEYLT